MRRYMTIQHTTKKGRKIGVLIFRRGKYVALCHNCHEENWVNSSVENWVIRETDLGDFRQQCEYCDKELNPKASASMPELFTERKYIKAWGDTRIIKPRLPAPS